MIHDKSNFISNSSIIIGNDVLISDRVTIIWNIEIGAIIADGPVVTKNVLPYPIVGRVPTKIIKNRFDENTIIKIEEMNLLNDDIVKKYRYFFNYLIY